MTRRGAGGAHAVAGNGFVAAAFRHRTSRAGDPQLHTHVLVANLTLGADRAWSTLDGRRIYAHATTAGYLYEARLRSVLTRELGVEWTPVRNGIADIAGVPPKVLRAFSRRRAEIEAELERGGASSATAAQDAALAARRGARRTIASRPSSSCRSGAGAPARSGSRPSWSGSSGGRARSEPLSAELAERIADWLAGSAGLTERRATFTRRDVLQMFCEQLPAGVDVSTARRRAARRRVRALAACRRARRG